MKSILIPFSAPRRDNLRQ